MGLKSLFQKSIVSRILVIIALGYPAPASFSRAVKHAPAPPLIEFRAGRETPAAPAVFGLISANIVLSLRESYLRRLSCATQKKIRIATEMKDKYMRAASLRPLSNTRCSRYNIFFASLFAGSSYLLYSSSRWLGLHGRSRGLTRRLRC